MDGVIKMRLSIKNEQMDLFKRDNLQANLDFFYERHLDLFDTGKIGS